MFHCAVIPSEVLCAARFLFKTRRKSCPFVYLRLQEDTEKYSHEKEVQISVQCKRLTTASCLQAEQHDNLQPPLVGGLRRVMYPLLYF